MHTLGTRNKRSLKKSGALIRVVVRFVSATAGKRHQMRIVRGRSSCETQLRHDALACSARVGGAPAWPGIACSAMHEVSSWPRGRRLPAASAPLPDGRHGRRQANMPAGGSGRQRTLHRINLCQGTVLRGGAACGLPWLALLLLPRSLPGLHSSLISFAPPSTEAFIYALRMADPSPPPPAERRSPCNALAGSIA